jgi:hypothetical protein
VVFHVGHVEWLLGVVVDVVIPVLVVAMTTVVTTVVTTTTTTTTKPLLWLSIKEATAVAVAQQDIGGSLITARATR